MSFRAGIIAYPGSKSYLVKIIEELLPYKRDGKQMWFLDVFGGSGSVILNKKPHDLNIYNDISRNIVNLMLQLKFNFVQFKEKAKYLLACKEFYDKVFEMHKNNYEGLDDLDKAVYYAYYASMTIPQALIENNYGFNFITGRHWQQFYQRIDVLFNKLRNITILCEDYKILLKKYNKPHLIVYLDPPYLNGNYNYGQEGIDHEELAELLKKANFMWIMSHSENKKIKELYKGYNYLEINCKSFINLKRRQYKEWLIANYDLRQFTLHKIDIL